MGLKNFLVSKKGAAVAGILGLGAGAGANVAIAGTQKADLAAEATNTKLMEVATELGVPNMPLDQVLYEINFAAQRGNSYAMQILNDLDLAGKAAEATAYWQPQSIAGAVAAFVGVVGIYLVARHFAKKSVKAQENSRELN